MCELVQVNNQTHTHSHTQTHKPVHVILPPWYDAVVALPSGAHVNGAVPALEWNPGLHDSMQVCLCLP